MIKAIFFDVDGTLVSFKTHTISKAVLQALVRLRGQGIKLFLSTGRHPAMLGNVTELFPFDGYVTLSGQYCYCNDRVVRSNPIAPQGVAALVEAARTRQFCCLFMEGEALYINYPDQSIHALMDTLSLPVPKVADPGRALGREVYQAIAFLTEGQEHLLLSHAPSLKTTRWHPSFLDVIPDSGGKDKGLEAMLEQFQIAPQETMAFGDGENDLSMLAYAGIGVAMGSASDTVKAGADFVTGTAEQDGILTALTHFGLL